MLGPIVQIAGTLLGQWQESRSRKQEREDRVKEAKVDATITRLQSAQGAEHEWERLMAEGSKDSWKDEFWTLILAAPLVMLFWPDPEVNAIATQGFDRMGDAPDWYVAAVGLAIGSAFGYRKLVKPFLRKKV